MELREQLQHSLGPAYILEDELGGGGMSRVFVATEVALSRRVVVKVLLPQLAAGVSATRFTREIRFAASLQHPNVVPVLAAGEANGLPYYTMPFVPGASLRTRLDGADPVPLREAVGLLRDVARALAYAHDHGVVHRDVKPENVLLASEAAVVSDFGIAKAISVALTEDSSGATGGTTVTQAGMAIGTPAYMSPEQVASDPTIDHRSDLYSFGCLAYELLAGRPVFAERPVHQLLAAHLSEAPAPLGPLCPSCPPDLVHIVMQCLEKMPDRRPASAREVLRVLDASTGSTSSLARWRNRFSLRQRRAAGVAILGALALSAALFFRPWRGRTTGAPSLAVLPFVNIGGDSTRDLWAEGLTDEVMTGLRRGSSVRLASRGAVERYHGRRNVDPREVGRLLQVNHVLQGTLWPVGGRVRVQAWLSDAGEGREVWRDTFERDAADVLAMLDSLTAGISAAVHRELLGPAPSALVTTTRGTSDSIAYELYLRGQVMLRARASGVPRAAELFQQAITRDPGFARAHSALSAALEILPNFADTTYQQVFDQATASARRALALDSTLAQAHTSLALAAMNAFRWDEAGREFRQALALDPDDGFTHMHYGRYLVYTGRLGEAAEELRRATALEPTAAVIGGWLATTLWLNGRLAEAATEIDRALELDSTSVPIALFGAGVSLARGQEDRARRLAELSWRPMGVPRSAGWVAATSLVYARMGDLATVRTILRYLDSVPRSRAFDHSSLATVAIALRDSARALQEFELATEAGEFWPSAPILALPDLDFLRPNPRFAALLRRVGLEVSVFTSPTGGRPQ